jgi:hypothetical protein
MRFWLDRGSPAYQSINVEAQLRTPSSMLNWVKVLVAARKKNPRLRARQSPLPRPGQREHPRSWAGARGREPYSSSTTSPGRPSPPSGISASGSSHAAGAARGDPLSSRTGAPILRQPRPVRVLLVPAGAARAERVYVRHRGQSALAAARAGRSTKDGRPLPFDRVVRIRRFARQRR